MAHSMLDPKHTCWWSRRRLTELRWEGQEFQAAGVSLRVLLSALIDPSLVWYSIRHGEKFDDQFPDNIMAVAMDRSAAERLPHSGDPQPGPVTESIGDVHRVTESMLDKGTALTFTNLSIEELSQRARYRLSIHDDCFGAVVPVTNETAIRVVRCVLELHGFYLQQDLDWSAVADRVLQLLQQHTKISLQSKREWWNRTAHVEIRLPRGVWMPGRKLANIQVDDRILKFRLLQ